jgi:undecaprenyl diphosphate synthase
MADPADLSGLPRPRHIAIIMDGNGRWAKKRMLPRTAGHRAGVQSVRRTVEACVELGVEALTLFAFSSENWRRPHSEVQVLMELLAQTLDKEVDRLHEKGIRLRFIGDRLAFPPDLRRRIERGEALTADNDRLTLVIAANYGGRWDIAQAARRVAERVAAGELDPGDIDAELLGRHMALADVPEPDLFVRTGGEQRVSNFLLWQLAYTELFFTDVLWPDFDVAVLREAISAYGSRQRRFGRTGEQVEQLSGA